MLVEAWGAAAEARTDQQRFLTGKHQIMTQITYHWKVQVQHWQPEKKQQRGRQVTLPWSAYPTLYRLRSAPKGVSHLRVPNL